MCKYVWLIVSNMVSIDTQNAFTTSIMSRINVVKVLFTSIETT